MAVMRSLDRYLASWTDIRALIIGDVILDRYVAGKVRRISPEAPVPIVETEAHQVRLGGAANVALNVAALGANPVVCSLVGQDSAGDALCALMNKQQLNIKNLARSNQRPTTTKTRILSNNHCLLRIDEEDTQWITSHEAEWLLGRVKALLDEVDVVLFEDYDKGVLTPWLIDEIIKIAKTKAILVCADPKYRQFKCYKGITMLKPNLSELYQALSKPIPNPLTIEAVKKDAQSLLSMLGLDHLIVTLSDRGIVGCSQDGLCVHIPAHVRQIADVSGAGDAVFSVLGLGLAAHTPIPVLLELANLAGGIVCEKPTVIPIQYQTLLEAAQTSPYLEEVLNKKTES